MDDQEAEDLLNTARERGLEWLDARCADGTLIDEAEATQRGAGVRGAAELATISVRGRRFHLASSLTLPANFVRCVNEALGVAGDSARLLFWMQRYGALKANTVPEAIRDGRLSQCVELALVYADEMGYRQK